MEHDPMTIKVRLLKDKSTINKTFAKGSIQMAEANSMGVLNIQGYPAVTLVESDWRPVWDSTDLIAR